MSTQDSPDAVETQSRSRKDILRGDLSHELPTQRANLEILEIAVKVKGASVKLEGRVNRTSMIALRLLIIAIVTGILTGVSVAFGGHSGSRQVFFIVGSLLVGALGASAGLFLSLPRKREEQAKLKDLEGTLRSLPSDSGTDSKVIAQSGEAEDPSV
jgi:hypothetical protein